MEVLYIVRLQFCHLVSDLQDRGRVDDRRRVERIQREGVQWCVAEKTKNNKDIRTVEVLVRPRFCHLVSDLLSAGGTHLIAYGTGGALGGRVKKIQKDSKKQGQWCVAERGKNNKDIRTVEVLHIGRPRFQCYPREMGVWMQISTYRIGDASKGFKDRRG
ncbi:hypothetical protein BDP27DRAFT_1356445 [Rhodocollybia butyracea]|uniref:Uncharacterized protein n=1 Tax=Rhodocollybia butyracea TaxID=206335 RepID=A0A9P5Q5R7_9AGAR|nr:hypothetical protein BDP27DRAFT_1356445 [Rhodocollybia butyracea]